MVKNCLCLRQRRNQICCKGNKWLQPKMITATMAFQNIQFSLLDNLTEDESKPRSLFLCVPVILVHAESTGNIFDTKCFMKTCSIDYGKFWKWNNKHKLYTICQISNWPDIKMKWSRTDQFRTKQLKSSILTVEYMSKCPMVVLTWQVKTLELSYIILLIHF